jgi:CRISPR system Cascade subunit CasE
MLFVSRIFLNPFSRNVRRDVSNRYELHRTLMRAFEDHENEDGNPRSDFNVLYRLEKDTNFNILKLTVQSSAEPNWENVEAKYPGYFAPKSLLDPEERIKPYETKDITKIFESIKTGQEYKFFVEASPTKNVLLDNIRSYRESARNDGYSDGMFKIMNEKNPSDEEKKETKILVESAQQAKRTSKKSSGNTAKKSTKKSTKKTTKQANDEADDIKTTQIQGLNDGGAKKRIRIALTYIGDQLEWMKEKAEKSGFKIQRIISFDDKLEVISGKKKTNQDKIDRITTKSIKVLGVLQITDEKAFKKAFLEGLGKGKTFGCGMISITKA